MILHRNCGGSFDLLVRFKQIAVIPDLTKPTSMNPLIELAGKIWRRMPKRVRRWGVLLTESRFTVTVGAVVVNGSGQILLLQHRFRAGSGWGIPGGFIQPGEQPEDAIRRELLEEIGLEVSELEVAFVRSLTRYKQVEVIFLCRPQSDFQPLGREIESAAWFTPYEFPYGLSDDQRRLIERAINQKSETDKL